MARARLNFKNSGNPFKQILTAIISLLVLGLTLTFGLIILGVLLVIGLIFGLYFWWKTRALRSLLHAQMAQNAQAQGQDYANNPEKRAAEESSAFPSAENIIIEGEAHRLPDEK